MCTMLTTNYFEVLHSSKERAMCTDLVYGKGLTCNSFFKVVGLLAVLSIIFLYYSRLSLEGARKHVSYNNKWVHIYLLLKLEAPIPILANALSF